MSKRPYKSNYKTDEDTNLNQAIGKKIKEARNSRIIYITVPEVKNIIVGHTIKKEKPCTQTELAKALGVTFQQIQKYEKGFNGLSSIKLLKISKFFNKPLEYFTSDATDLLGQNNLPDKNPNVALAPSNVTGLN
tara:strand:+ start:14978 stop:15379 length:402 start_codon:yes stop_codon:yes gene_type:complete